MDKATGFGQGGDDYITKPFARQELVMRIEAVLRRAMPRPAAMSEKIVLGDLTIFPKNYSVLVGGVEAGLKAREFEVLRLLASYPGQVFTHRAIYEEVWGGGSPGGENAVAVYIKRIREKIEQDPRHPAHLITVWGVGYKLE